MPQFVRGVALYSLKVKSCLAGLTPPRQRPRLTPCFARSYAVLSSAHRAHKITVSPPRAGQEREHMEEHPSKAPGTALRGSVWALTTACFVLGPGCARTPSTYPSEQETQMPIVSSDFASTTLPSPIPASARVPLDDERDRLRHPLELMKFLKLQEGMVVVEIGSGDGYTAMHVASALNGKGRVLAQNPPEWRGFLQPYLTARLRNGPLKGVEWVEEPFDAPVTAEPGSVDRVLNILTYHDLPYMDVDRAKMNRAIFTMLKPGGAYIVVDHSARKQDADKVASTLHRIAEGLVVAEVEHAGLRLDETADFLRYPDDNLMSLAWAKPQPKTDRFVLRFVKPMQ